MSNEAIIVVSKKVLAEALHLPKGVEVDHVLQPNDYDREQGWLRVILSDHRFPPVLEGASPDVADVTQIKHDDGRIETAIHIQGRTIR